MAFGRIAEITGNMNVTVQDVRDTTALRSYLEATYPAMKTAKYVLAVNKQIVHTETVLPDAATVALLPPFSGG